MYEEMNFDSILDKMLGRVSEMLPELDTREGSVIYNALAPAAMEMQDIYIALDTVLNESFADTQSKEFLKRRCAERGIYPDEATCAVRMGEFTGRYNNAHLIGAEFSLGRLTYVGLKCYMSFFELECDTPGEIGNLDIGELIPIANIEGLESARLSDILTYGKDIDGTAPATKAICLGEFSGSFDNENLLGKRLSLGELTYKVIGKLSEKELNNDRHDIFMMECKTKGKVGNLDKGDLIPVKYIEGLDSAELTGTFTSGRDEEDTEHLRQRYFDNANAFAFGGNIADYKTKVLSLSSSEFGRGNKDVRDAGGVGYVKVIPAWDGPGTVQIIILDAEFKTRLTGKDHLSPGYLTGDDLVVAVQNAIDPKKSTGEGVGIAPIGHVVTVVSAKEKPIEVSATITYMDPSNATNKNAVENALRSYYTMRIKEWKDDEPLIITIGEIYMCMEAVPRVESIEIQDMKLNGEYSVEIGLDSIPVFGGLNNGQGN